MKIKTREQKEDELNHIGNVMAVSLGLKRVQGEDSQGRVRWVTNDGWGDKTGIGLLRMIQSQFRLIPRDIKRAL